MVVYCRAGAQEARKIIRRFLAMLGGHVQADQLAQGVFFAIGLEALSDIHADFIRKAQGGVGEDGASWPRLSPKTLAYSRRFGPGEQAGLKAAAGLGRANRLAPGGNKGLLTVAQLKRWRQVYSQHLARLVMMYPLAQAKSIAAGIAWNKVKAEGAKTKLEVFGNRPHEPLRDTGVLLNSLSPGYLIWGEYHKPIRDGAEFQIFQSLENGVVVGTNVPYAKTHNEGDRSRGIPARPFIPTVVPARWIQGWADVGIKAVEFALSRSLEAA